ncbi:(Fe-S)-binding protein [Luteolibacter sp. Populi]|uniref:(Fe-S)-binding protein n=1 Tax=Luteolibacter sp. Populi TaxID=3230487 RepID=UPI00346524BC
MAATSLKALDYSILQQCMHCGMCLPTCPTYDATLRERSSPRGRIALMRAVADDELEVSGIFADEMSFCLGCLACQTACPAGVDYATLFETARAEVEESRVRTNPARSFWRWLTLDFLFMHPRALRAAGSLLRFYQRSGLERFVKKAGLLRLLPSNLRRLEPQTPRMAEKFSDDLIAEIEGPATPLPGRKVALLTGCIQDLAFSDINRDTADVLLANGCTVHTPPVQPCCGSLHSHNGEPLMAAELARRMIDLFPPGSFDAIITNAGGCGSHLRHYSGLLGNDPVYGPLAKEWDAKVKDIHEYLIAIGCRPPSGIAQPRVITYHESCHLTHGQKVRREPRQILALLPHTKLVELPEASWCCGSAGIYNITQPEMSAQLLERKIAHLKSTGANILATSNPGCHMQLARGIADAGLAIEILQPVTLLAHAYRRETSLSDS